MKHIELQVERWGNSLAVRLPAEYAKRAGFSEGDTLVLEEATDGTLTWRPARYFDRSTFLKLVKATKSSMVMGDSVIDEIRRDARY